MADASATFDKKEEVDPIRHLLGTASYGVGGLAEKEAYDLNVELSLPVDAYQLTVKGERLDWALA